MFNYNACTAVIKNILETENLKVTFDNNIDHASMYQDASTDWLEDLDYDFESFGEDGLKITVRFEVDEEKFHKVVTDAYEAFLADVEGTVGPRGKSVFLWKASAETGAKMTNELEALAYELRNEMKDDIIRAAFESGSTDWYASREYNMLTGIVEDLVEFEFVYPDLDSLALDEAA